MAIFTAIATAILGAGASAFWIGVTAAGLEVATGIAVNLIAKSISGQGSNSDATQFGVQGTLQAGGDIERSFPLGYAGLAGSLVYANEWGEVDKTPNAYNTQVICVSDLPVAGPGATGLRQLYVNGSLCTIEWGSAPTAQGYPVTEYRDDAGKDHLWIKFYDGTQTAADTFLTGTVSSTERPYGATRVGTGCAYVIATALVNDGLFNGFPNYKFGIGPVKLYDPSKDSTVGGSGSHRWDSPSTWGGDGDDLPAVQMYNLLRGITFNGQWLYGLQNTQAARLPAAHWIGQINKCRALIAGPDGNEATYRAGGEVGVNATIADTATTLLTSCQGRLAEIGGVFKIYVGAPGDASFSFDDGTILSTEEQTFTPFFGLADTVNGITAKYPDPAQGWNTVVAPALYNADYETEDGNRRLLSDVSLDFVPYAGQVQRLMKSALAEARRARRHTIVLPPEYWAVEPGDVVQWTSNRNGYDAKLFRVDGVSDRANLDVMVDITEVDPSDYDWDQDTDFTPVVVGSLLPARPGVQQVHGFSVGPAFIFDSAGVGRKPTIQVFWDGDQPDVIAVLWQVRLASDGTLAATGQIDDIAAGEGVLPPLFLGSTDYQVRIKYRPGGNRPVEWSDWLDVTTFAAGDTTIGDLSQELQDVLKWTQDAVVNLLQVADGLSAIVQDQDLANFTDKQTIRREVHSANASIIERLVAATGPDSALAQSVTVLQAAVGTANALIATEQEARIDADNVLTTATELLRAALGGSDAEVNVTFAAEAAPTGFSARYSIRCAVDDGQLRQGSIFLDVPENPDEPVRIGFQADETVFFASDGTPLALIDGDGNLKSANNAILLQVITGVVQFNSV